MTFDVETLKVTDQHKALAAFIKTEAGKAPSASTVALVLTLAAEYRKSEAYLEQQAARQKAKDDKAAALLARKRERLEKALETARKLAADLGLAVPAIDGEFEHPTPVVEVEEEPEPEPVVVKAPAKRKTAGPKAATITAVPDVEDTDPGDPAEDTSAIVVVESEDVFESMEPEVEDDEDDFLDDDPEEY